MDYEYFFDQFGEETLDDLADAVTLEELYQAIKDRLIDELHIEPQRRE